MSLTESSRHDSCFLEYEIRDILLGRVTSSAADRCAKHLSRCPDCAALADGIGLDPEIVSSLREEELPVLPSDDEIADLMARVEKMELATQTKPVKDAWTYFDLPEQLGPYRLVDFIGVGGMGVVFRAEDTVLHRMVAVKVIKGGADVQARVQLLNEARALAAVRHENVVTVYFVGEAPGRLDGEVIPYFAMELLEGQSLRDWMATSKSSVDWIVQLGRQIAAGLLVVHQAGIVHRDIKPGNVWLQKVADGPKREEWVPQVKLLDFGIAHQSSGLSVVQRAGTPAYVAPEQVRGGDVDAKADLFSLGCVLFELCTGKLPFPESGSMRTRWGVAPTSACQLNPEVPRRLSRLIDAMLSIDPSGRPSSARAVEIELASLSTNAAEAATIVSSGDATVILPKEQRSRSALRWLSAGLLVASIVVAVVTMFNVDLKRGTPQAESDVSNDEMDAVTSAKVETPADALTSVSDDVDERWIRDVQAKLPQLQLNAVLMKLARLNPKFDWLTGSGWVEPYGVIRITLDADVVSDLRPVMALQQLSVIRCRGSAPGMGTVKDLSPLSGLKLQELHCPNNPLLKDLSMIRLENLTFLDATYTSLESLNGLEKAPLNQLKIIGTNISDLTPLRKMKTLHRLYCNGCPITDFRPIAQLPLRQIRGDFILERDESVLRSIKSLQMINGLPVKDFWQQPTRQAQDQTSIGDD